MRKNHLVIENIFVFTYKTTTFVIIRRSASAFPDLLSAPFSSVSAFR